MNTKKLKVAELAGAELDWAVARCVGLSHKLHGRVPYSSDPVHAHPIIERERISLFHYQSDELGQPCEPGWSAFLIAEKLSYGPTPLVAAMRAYVTSCVGDEIDVPAEVSA